MTLPKHERIKDRHIFRTLPSFEKLGGGQGFVLLAKKRQAQQKSSQRLQYAFIVKKKTSKRAVVRNYLRRRLSEVLQAVRQQYPEETQLWEQDYRYMAFLLDARLLQSSLEQDLQALSRIWLRRRGRQ